MMTQTSIPVHYSPKRSMLVIMRIVMNRFLCPEQVYACSISSSLKESTSALYTEADCFFVINPCVYAVKCRIFNAFSGVALTSAIHSMTILSDQNRYPHLKPLRNQGFQRFYALFFQSVFYRYTRAFQSVKQDLN